jgi:hypothetical protein
LVLDELGAALSRGDGGHILGKVCTQGNPVERRIREMVFASCALMADVAVLGGCASNRLSEVKPASMPAAEPKNPVEEVGAKAEEIITQPARDVGIAEIAIPAPLAKASEDPYSLKGIRTCAQIAAAVIELNEVLGPDFVVGDKMNQNRAAKIAEAGGKTIVNALIPFRALVRELTGAAPAQRRLNAAIDAGYARRGFLRGVHRTRGCRTTF